MSCTSVCKLGFLRGIKRFLDDDEESLNFLRQHGVIPYQVKCPRCKEDCVLTDRGLFRCNRKIVKPKTKKRKLCGFSVSQFKGTFLSQARIKPSKLLVFICYFLSKNWNHQTLIEELEISSKTSVDWRSFCSEVCEKWFYDQKPIGGPGKKVEIDETCIVKRKYNRGRVLNQVWLFGGIERESKERFIIPLLGEKRDKDTLLPLIGQFILPGTVIYSDGWAAYRDIESELGFKHHVINHSENFVHKENPDIHTQNVERLWGDVKAWVKRPGIRAKYLRQYLSRYLFCTAHKRQERLHYFLLAVKELYPFCAV